MSLTDIMSHADLSLYPEVSLVIFLAVFAAVAFRVSKRDASEDARDASLPLNHEIGTCADRSAGADQ